MLAFSHRDIVYALKSHFQVLLPFLEFETVEGPKCFLTLLVTLLCHSFLWLRFKQAAVEKRLKGVGKYGICFPHFFLVKKDFSSVLFQALHSVFTERCIPWVPETFLARFPVSVKS